MYLTQIIILISAAAVQLPDLIYGDHMAFPIKIGPLWVPVNPNKLKCPVGSFKPKPVHSKLEIDVAVVRPTYSHNRTIQGYLCHKYLLETTCDQNFVFSSTYTKRFSNLEISNEECTDAVLKWSQGIDPPSDYPLPSCTWMDTNTESKTFIKVTPHNVAFDPYSGSLIDPIFLGGRSMETISDTIYDSVKWIGIGSDLIKQCENIEGSRGIIHFS